MEFKDFPDELLYYIISFLLYKQTDFVDVYEDDYTKNYKYYVYTDMNLVSKRFYNMLKEQFSYKLLIVFGDKKPLAIGGFHYIDLKHDYSYTVYMNFERETINDDTIELIRKTKSLQYVYVDIPLEASYVYDYRKDNMEDFIKEFMPDYNRYWHDRMLDYDRIRWHW